MKKPFIFPFDNSLDLSKIPFVEANDSNYEYNGIKVPRVTHILQSMLHDDYLIPWANAMGLYKHQKYSDIMEKSTEIGSIVHNAIENFLRNGIELDINSIPNMYANEALNAYTAFKKWWKTIETHQYKILMEETTLVCNYYGGTLDLLIEIDGKIYLLDFKTSNHLSYKYFLQLAAYRRLLFYEMNISIDGIIILQLGKKFQIFNEVILFMDNLKDAEYMRQCDIMFMTLVYSYYQRLHIESNASVYLNKG